MFSIKSLSVSIDSTPLLRHINMTIAPGQIHAIMGPNGSGKSTLAHTIMAHPLYEITHGTITMEDTLLDSLSTHERAQAGVFVSFQQPPALPGLRVLSLLKEIRQAQHSELIDHAIFAQEIQQYLTFLQMDEAFLERSCNDGFSGGERKRLELLQLLVARPRLIILDEIDSGLDIDALRLVAQVINKMKADDPYCMMLIITHYQRILEYVIPDHVHVLIDGTIVTSGDAALVQTVERNGYTNIL